jgi:hypothetical protein
MNACILDGFRSENLRNFARLRWLWYAPGTIGKMFTDS